MKAFEKLYQEKYPIPPTTEPGPVTREFKQGCAEFWKEALLWFWKVAEHLSPSDYEILEKELEDETKKD